MLETVVITLFLSKFYARTHAWTDGRMQGRTDAPSTYSHTHPPHTHTHTHTHTNQFDVAQDTHTHTRTRTHAPPPPPHTHHFDVAQNPGIHKRLNMLNVQVLHHQH